jgi:hypothetical protein
VTTDRRLIIAATALLDSAIRGPSRSGQSAMVPEISHDASYKHYESRDALLAVVAMVALDSHTGRAELELLCELAQEVPQ